MTVATPTRGRQGQTFILVVLMTAVVALLLLTAFDIFLAARQKVRLITAGDAGALAAAHWQAVTLNLLGEVNLAHLAAACDMPLDPVDRTNVIDGVNALAERLAFAGPVMGLYAANRAVEANFRAQAAGAVAHLPTDPDFNAILDREAAAVRTLAPSATWPTKGADYAAMLDCVRTHGVYAGCDNARLFSSGATGPHIYYSYNFYNAARADGACTWFCRYFGYDHDRAIAELAAMAPPSATDLAATATASAGNAGFFGVGVCLAHTPPGAVADFPGNALLRLWSRFGSGGAPVTWPTLTESDAAYDRRFAWVYFEPGTFWRSWKELGPGTSGALPLVHAVQPALDVYGAQAAVRVARTLTLLAAPETNDFIWTAAAKPLGQLDDATRVTDLFGNWSGDDWSHAALVTPAFAQVRLVPLGGVGANQLRKADLTWLAHLDHLSTATRQPDCFRCQIIATWEENGGAAAAADWLRAHDHEEVCLPHGKGGSYGGDDEFSN